MWRKWVGLFRVWLQDGLAYRANGVIWILTDAVPACIMPIVFIASLQGRETIAGYSASGFVLYYLTMLLFTNFITSHLMWELAYEIKEGVFTNHLIRPISYFQVTFIRNLTWRLLRLTYFAPMALIIGALFWGYLRDAEWYLGWDVVAAVVLGHLVSFSFVYMMSMLAFIFTETESIFGLYYIPMLFLSGQLFPVALLPDWALLVGKLFPFYYTTAFPVELVTGKIAGSAVVAGLLIQIAWIAAQLIGAQFLWRFGIRRYTAVGM